jgi:hypothetical protein
MIRLEEIAIAALAGDALLARSRAQEFLATAVNFADVPIPPTTDATVLAVSAALIELFATRRGEPPPDWSRDVGPLSEPLFLLRSAARMPRLRRMCELDSPAPMRRRRIFVPSNYLSAA